MSLVEVVLVWLESRMKGKGLGSFTKKNKVSKYSVYFMPSSKRLKTNQLFGTHLKWSHMGHIYGA